MEELINLDLTGRVRREKRVPEAGRKKKSDLSILMPCYPDSKAEAPIMANPYFCPRLLS